MTTQTALKKAKILVVDDEPVNLEVLQEILEDAGFTQVVSTTDPIKAVRMFKERDFDLVLLDLLMPGLSGFDVMERFKAVGKEDETPILVLTALRDRETRLRALTRGASDFLVKPFDHQEAVSRIHNLLEMRLARKELREHNIILDRKVRERTRELEETRLEIVRRLGIAAEYRDKEAGLHIIRISLFSRALGKAVGMNDGEAELLMNASPMHDVGKIGIPDSILLKPRKLEPKEWEIIKTHSTIGAKILGGHDSKLLQSARIIAHTHHEKWDGTGYPAGIAGEEIPLIGRIVAVADVFDALTSQRPYKEPWPVEKAVAFLEKNNGKLFDPRILTAFKEILPEILGIKSRYKEPKIQKGD